MSDSSRIGGLWGFFVPIVEFLGILVPGIVFLSALVPAAVIPGILFFSFLRDPSSLTLVSTAPFIEMGSVSNVFLISVFLVFAYVSGHISFRRTPKIPDEFSFHRVKEEIGGDGPVRLCDAEMEHNIALGKPNKYNTEFPYHYLYEYLHGRGLEHLAEMVPWRGSDPTTYEGRTKHFINLLKVRLEFLFPRQYTRIQRNEAHVRLMSSIWYVASGLVKISLIGAATAAIIAAYMAYQSNDWWPIPFGVVVVSPVAVLLLSLVGQREVERFLHYQRIREIVFILEAAHFANRLVPDLDLLNPLGKKPDDAS